MKRVLSLLLALTFVVGCFSVSAFAQDTNYDNEIQAQSLSMQTVEWSEPERLGFTGAYPRLTTVGNGSLLAAYERGGKLNVSRSADGGKTWPTSHIVAYDPSDTGYHPGNPYPYYDSDTKILYLAFRCPIENADGTYTANICYVTSEDYGNTWSEPVTVASSTVPNEATYGGMWEPSIYKIDGTLFMYYSCDTVKYGSGQVKINVGSASESTDTAFPYVSSKAYQNIVLHTLDRSTGLWSGGVCAQRGQDHYNYGTQYGYSSREGMQSISKLSDGTYAMTIETSKETFAHMYGGKKYAFVVDISFSRDGITWTKPKTIATPTKEGGYYAAPWIDTLPDGRIIISFQTDEHLSNVIDEGEAAQKRHQLKVLVSKEVVSYSDNSSVKAADFDMYKPFDSLNSEVTYNPWNSVYVDGYTAYAIGSISTNDSTVTTGKGLVISKFDSAPTQDTPAGYTPIYTANDMLNLMHQQEGFMWTGKYQLKADIDLLQGTIGLEQIPIGKSNTRNDFFNGVFDGAGNTMKVNITGSERYVGIFGYVLHSTIKNLKVSGSITSTYAGATSRNNNGTAIIAHINGDSTVDNVVNYATVTSSATAGGIVGYAFRNGTTEGAVNITNCTNYGVVKSSAATTDYGAAGGIVGAACANTFDVIISKCLNRGAVSAKRYIGGILGGANHESTGTCYVIIDECTNDGKVVGSVTDVGGIVGLGFYTKISNCQNRSDVQNVRTSGSKAASGGIAGRAHTNTTLENCVNTANAPSAGGAIVGTNDSTATVVISNCFYPVRNKTNVTTYGTMLTEAEAAHGSSYIGFDFDTVWTMEGGFADLKAYAEMTYSDAEYTALSTANDILALMNEAGPFTGNYVLTADIDLSKYTGSLSQACIGAEVATAFKGVFEGNGYTVSGINITNTAKTGFFGYLNGATVRNLTLEGTVTSTKAYTGILAGIVNGDTTIENCTVRGTVTGTEMVGGLVGYALVNGADAQVRILGCKNEATVTGTQTKIGGIAGYVKIEKENDSALISGCVNSGNVTTTLTGDGYVAGIVGMVRNHLERTVEAEDGTESKVTEYGEGTAIVGCANYGTIESKGKRAAGILASTLDDKTSSSIVSNCVNYGEIIGTNDLGGIVAVAQALNIQSCINYGKVSGTGTGVSTLVGKKWTTTGYAEAEIKNCYDLSGTETQLIANASEQFAVAYPVTNCVKLSEGINSLSSFTGLDGALWYAGESGPFLRSSHDTCEYVYTVIKAPTYDANGEGAYACPTCGKIRSTFVIEKYAPMLGDIDGDRAITNTDVTLLIRVLSGWNDTYVSVNTDMNSDGKINNRDAIALIVKISL